MIHTSTAPGAKPGWLTSTAVSAAVALSATIAAVGVVVTFGDRAAAGDPWSIGALAGGVALLVLTEVGAVLSLLAAQRRAGEGHRAVAAVALALFVVLTGANLAAGHFGAKALNDRLVAAQRAPFETEAAAAAATLAQAGEAKASFEPRAGDELARLEASLAAEREAASLAVTARARAAQAARDALAARQAAERQALAAAVTDATARQAQAASALAGAPAGFGEAQLWGFAVVLELLKGLLAWVAVPRRRRQDPSGATIVIAPGDASLLTEAELLAEQRRARAWATTIQHELRRRAQASA